MRPDSVMFAVYTCIFHGSMGLSVYLASTVIGWKGAFLWALMIGLIMEFKRGR